MVLHNKQQQRLPDGEPHYGLRHIDIYYLFGRLMLGGMFPFRRFGSKSNSNRSRCFSLIPFFEDKNSN